MRGRHDDRLGARQQLPERDGHVAGSRRHVHDERVQLAPVHVGEELLERPVEHGPAPHDRRVLVEEEADRHHLEVAADGRDDHRPLAAVDRDGPLVDAEHVRDRVAVDVGVEDARPLAEASRTPRRGSPRATTCRRRPCRSPRRAPACASRPRFPGVRSVTPPRRRVVSAAFSSGVITSNAELDLVDALEGQRARLDLLLEARAQRAAGHGERDRRRRRGRRRWSTSRTMSSSMTERPSSGS